jgi:hypothetical protein
MKRIICLLTIVACALLLNAQCTIKNTAFKSGETLSYNLYYNWKFIWARAGSATMSTFQSSYKGDSAFRCNLISRGTKQADRFFMMRDTLVSIVNKNMAPLYYRKGAFEGKRYKVDEIWYSYEDGDCHIHQRYRNAHGKITERYKKSDYCIYDMLSIVLRARNFDASDYKVGERIRFFMADGDDVENESLVYRGKDNYTVEGKTLTYRCLVFSFLERDKKTKNEKEIIKFYITDDNNHIPVRLDMNLSFGTAKAYLSGAWGVRNPMTCIVKR